MTAPLRHSRPVIRPKFSDRLPEPEVGTAGENQCRVMIIDDSLTVRTIFKRMVEGDPVLHVACTASSAENGIATLASQSVDVILLDLEMPGMGGLEALPAILDVAPDAQVLVVSSLTEDGAEHTIAALSMGAADTMLKPRPGGFNDEYRGQLLQKIRALGKCDESEEAERGNGSGASPGLRPTKAPEVVAIGASTGGIHAINLLLSHLPAEFSLPIVITQHLPSSFIPVFAKQVEMTSGRRTLIADDGTEIRRGEIAIASGQGHLEVRRVGDRLIARTSNKAASSGCLPSVDPMLSSLADCCDGRVLAIVLSGMGRDGLEGARQLAESGGTVFAQDAESSAVWGMPGAVANAGLVSLVAPPEELSQAIVARAGAAAWK